MTIEQLAEEYTNKMLDENNSMVISDYNLDAIFIAGAKAARSIYEAERAEMIGALDECKDEIMGCGAHRTTYAVDRARAALSKVSEINDAKESE